MYADYFQLAAEPFGLTPDPAFLYLSPEHREALAAVQYGLLDGRGFITLVGEVGTGKTTLLYSLLSQLNPSVSAAYIAYTTQSFEDLLAGVLRDFGVESGRSKQELLAAFNGYLMRQADEGRTVALIVDEAQNLSDQTFEELRLLSNFETYTRKLLQIVLVGQPELQERLRRPQLRQVHERISVRAFINPLSRIEMERYIEHRLQRVGGASERLFTPMARRLIVWRAAGIPRRANILCHNALLFAYGRGLPLVSPGIAREAIAEMDGRRPGLLPRRALRRVAPPFRVMRWAAAAVLALGAVVLADRLTSLALSGASAMSALLTGVPAQEAPAADVTADVGEHELDAVPVPPRAALEPTAEAVTPPAPSVPATVADVDAAGDPSAVVPPPTPQVVPPPVPVALAGYEPVPAAAPEAAGESMTVTIPPGSTLLGLLRSVYGDDMGDARAKELFSEILRLNPHVRDVNMIIAGDSLRIPRPAGKTR
jgi:general secretion pathway protein A